MDKIEVEVGQYREVIKGTLRGFFSLVIYPQGQKIMDCRYFVSGENRWFAFPCKEIKYTDGRKSEYIPYITYFNKEYRDALQAAVLEQLKNLQPRENHGQAKDRPQRNPSSPLQDNASADPFGEFPF